MGTGLYLGVNAYARKAKTVCIGINGVARKVKKAYIGVNGKARLFYQSDSPRRGQVFVSFNGGQYDHKVSVYSSDLTAIIDTLTDAATADTRDPGIIAGNKLMWARGQKLGALDLSSYAILSELTINGVTVNNTFAAFNGDLNGQLLLWASNKICRIDPNTGTYISDVCSESRLRQIGTGATNTIVYNAWYYDSDGDWSGWTYEINTTTGSRIRDVGIEGGATAINGDMILSSSPSRVSSYYKYVYNYSTLAQISRATTALINKLGAVQK